MDIIVGRAMLHMGDHAVRGRGILELRPGHRPKEGTLRKWYARRRKHGITSLIPDYRSRGGRGAGLDPAVQKIIWQIILRYMTFQGPSKKAIYQTIAKAVRDLNARRCDEKLPSLRSPCMTTVRKEIAKLDGLKVKIAREGEDRARKGLRSVAGGMLYTRPLERVEIHENKLDLWTLIEENDWQEKLSDETIEALGLREGKGRLWITMAICCTTKAVVGVTIAPSPTADAAIQTLAQTLSDKGVWADLVGALRPWNMFGRPEKIVSDCGSGFRSEAFRHACAELGIVAERVIAGVPEMRGAIERMFRTVNGGLCRRLAGSTFHEVISEAQSRDRPKGEDRPALTLEDLAFALVRWVVDVYHHSPHEGLAGETPEPAGTG